MLVDLRRANISPEQTNVFVLDLVVLHLRHLVLVVVEIAQLQEAHYRDIFRTMMMDTQASQSLAFSAGSLETARYAEKSSRNLRVHNRNLKNFHELWVANHNASFSLGEPLRP